MSGIPTTYSTHKDRYIRPFSIGQLRSERSRPVHLDYCDK